MKARGCYIITRGKKLSTISLTTVETCEEQLLLGAAAGHR